MYEALRGITAAYQVLAVLWLAWAFLPHSRWLKTSVSVWLAKMQAAWRPLGRPWDGLKACVCVCVCVCVACLYV
jgi:hypothetical protein